MGYRRRRHRYNRTSRAKWHIQQAQLFSEEVGQADELVKEAFYSLSGESLECLLKQYGERYGAAPESYARETIARWRSKKVRMSGMVAQRLFDLLPPLMPISQKHKIVEAIWRAYGPTSRHYLYLGRNANADEVVRAIDGYFDSLGILHKIPAKLEQKFDWLSSNDVAAKQQLLNHFMAEQRKAAIAAASLNIRMMLDAMNADVEGKISKLSHSVFVGNHNVEIKADPLRAGFAMSNSAHGMTKPPVRWTAPVALLTALAALILLMIYSFQRSTSGAASSVEATPQFQANMAASGVAEQVEAPSASAPTMTAAATAVPAQRLTFTPKQGTRASGAQPSSVSVSNAPTARPVADSATKGTSSSGSSCSNSVIASMEDDGATIRIASGMTMTVSSAGIQQIQAARWSTGDAVVVCTSASGGTTYASISNPSHFAKVQAVVNGSSAPQRVSCHDEQIVRVANDGASVITTDGTSYEISSSGIMRIQTGRWSTGDNVRVCEAGGPSIGAPASIDNSAHFAKTQATIVARGRAEPVNCRDTRLAAVSDGGASLKTVDGASYETADFGLFRIQAQRWSTGDAVTVCESRAGDGSVPASIANAAHFAKVQATRS